MQVEIVTQRYSDGAVGVRRTRSGAMSSDELEKVLREYGEVKLTRNAYGPVVVVSGVDPSKVDEIEAELCGVGVS